MNIEAFKEPISGDAPCGPDLNASMDAAYDEYYFGALGRLPSFYVRPGVQRPDGSYSPDQFFDPGEVDMDAEAREINALLERSYDLRLLVLRAQWEALSGRHRALADTVEAIALLLETFPETVHPQLADGVADRREALADLAQQVTVVQPLQFAGLTGTNEVSLRKMKVANGQANPLQDETELQARMLMDALGDVANRKAVDQVHGAMLRLADGIARIGRACQTNPQAPFSVPLSPVETVVQEVLELITEARPDLRGSDVVASAAPVAEPEPESDTAPVSSAPAAAAAAVTEAAPSDIKGHGHARMILESCERYYRRAEPSSAALLLVTQARLLIGKPLVEAMETLLPDQARSALVDFGPQTGFAIYADRLRSLSDALPEGPEGEAVQEPDPGPPPVFQTGPEAAGAMRSVEDYFRRVERSSPVPLLLQRARSYLDRDFQSLIEELIPRNDNG